MIIIRTCVTELANHYNVVQVLECIRQFVQSVAKPPSGLTYLMGVSKPFVVQTPRAATNDQQKPADKEYDYEAELAAFNSKRSLFGLIHGEIVWRNVLAFIYLHYATLQALYVIGTGQAKLSTCVLSYLFAGFAALGVTAGAHRLWTHNGYKAKWQLKLIWMYLNCMAFQNSVFEWARDHRAHHKFTDTHADPHNFQRGFFFSHIGWLMLKKHPDVKRVGGTIDMSDLERDPIVMFQKKYYIILMPVIGFLIPTYLTHYLTGDSVRTCWLLCGILKFTMSLHWAWLVNSAAHAWGDRPYDKGICPAENKFVSLVTHGEGWHNYHHVFPWDYKAAELPTYAYNTCTGFIDFFAYFGWAFDLRTVSQDLIKKRAARTGDGSLFKDDASYLLDGGAAINDDEDVIAGEHVWGWHDVDMTADRKQFADILNKSGDDD